MSTAEMAELRKLRKHAGARESREGERKKNRQLLESLLRAIHEVEMRLSAIERRQHELWMGRQS